MGEKGIMRGVHSAERQGWIQSPKCMHNWIPISLVFASCWNSCFWRSEFLMVVAVVIKFVSCQYPLFLKLVGTSKLRNRDLCVSRGKIQNASVNMCCMYTFATDNNSAGICSSCCVHKDWFDILCVNLAKTLKIGTLKYKLGLKRDPESQKGPYSIGTWSLK